ncbi:MAG TPA: outer membrane beta-barrel protein [Burkholderiaceae bacterium]|nr:outer membrane beta-barrel protein [Burkholderiaceae bacterium]
MNTKHIARLIKTAAGGSLIALASFTAHAADKEQGFYMGADIGRAKQNLDAGNLSSDRNTNSLNLYGGYKIDKNFAVELGYADLGKAKIGDASAKTKALNADLLASTALTQDLSLYGRLGAARYDRDFSTGSGDHTVGFKVGAGLEYKLSEQLSLRGEVTRYNNLPTADGQGFGRSANNVSAGLKYRF